MTESDEMIIWIYGIFTVISTIIVLIWGNLINKPPISKS